MKTTNIIFSITILLFFTHPLFAQDNFNEDWLNKDLQLFTKFLPVLESGELDVTRLMQIDDLMISDECENLGLGYYKTACYQSGGYTAIAIKILLNPNNLAIKYKIRISANINALNVINETINIYSLLSHYKEIRDGDRIMLDLEKTDDELFSKMMICFNEYFGINREIIIPDVLFKDYLLLTDPFNEGTYGFIVGYTASVPRFRSAIERIKEANNNDILMLIMASPNPTGRIYAIEALSKGDVNSIIENKIYSNILNRLFELKIPITVGAGCIMFDITIDSLRKLNEAMEYIIF